MWIYWLTQAHTHSHAYKCNLACKYTDRKWRSVENIECARKKNLFAKFIVFVWTEYNTDTNWLVTQHREYLYITKKEEKKTKAENSTINIWMDFIFSFFFCIFVLFIWMFAQSTAHYSFDRSMFCANAAISFMFI